MDKKTKERILKVMKPMSLQQLKHSFEEDGEMWMLGLGMFIVTISIILLWGGYIG